MTIKFIEDDKKRDVKGPLQKLVLIDRRFQNLDHQVKVCPSQEGDYYLLIGDDDGAMLSNIKGTIEITAE